ncbi:DUF2971 domain-containing protein [Pseudomonas chlororaphis]|uniref:DUF2971 domain-containing protein n=1 Tax=Pseudomonas chlororaphis TaxID=587753 RepID=A0A1Q8EQC1_9PSED|nr:DUF2971 domain-containing protein [Pseudomonas chlororaphis]OLF53997.1 hypothetical protein BTN82_13135 [Pseudomonas chlororaphis]
MMDKFLYRFRPAARLLGGKDDQGVEQPGELENLEIYFAAPEQLNDPLEGYREVFWAGDTLLWKNLLKHYLLLLALKSWELMLLGDGERYSNALKVHARVSRLEPTCATCFAEMLEKLFADSVIQSYIAALSKDQRRCYQPELIHHLVRLHPIFLSVVFQVNKDTWIGSLRYEPMAENADEKNARYSTELARIALEDTDEKRFSYYREAALDKAMFDIMMGNVGHRFFSGEKAVGMNSLIREFPHGFVKALDELMYPRWYVACFMDECRNSSIWGSYGGNHKAICLKFKVDSHQAGHSLKLKMPKESLDDRLVYDFKNMPFQEVSYSREFSHVDFFRTMGNTSPEALLEDWHFDSNLFSFSSSFEWLFSEDRQATARHFEKFNAILTSKLSHWESEKEFRIVLKSNMDLRDGAKRKVRYKFKSLDGLIFGIATPVADKIRAIEVVKALCDKHKRKTFNFYQAYYDPASKAIGYDLLDVLGFPRTLT